MNNEGINEIKKGDKNLISRNLKFIGYNKIILEAGAGTSQLSNYLAIGSNNKVFALDPTTESDTGANLQKIN